MGNYGQLWATMGLCLLVGTTLHVSLSLSLARALSPPEIRAIALDSCMPQGRINTNPKKVLIIRPKDAQNGVSVSNRCVNGCSNSDIDSQPEEALYLPTFSHL
jgi:hypothetical protein